RTEVSVVKDFSEKLEDRFAFSWASTGAHGQFASSYHIKVASRIRKAIWLSSGNWQSSNQPDIDFLRGGDGTSVPPELQRTFVKYNREWHAICHSPALAETF